jgi:hypothetical protein
VATFLTVCDRLGFDLAQPAQIWNSYLSFEFLSQGSVFARDTTFVEGGPIFAVSPRIRPKIVPFPETTEKGWGTDIAWSDYIAEGYRFGVVDAMPFEHLSPIGSAYDRGPELERTEAIMAERGLTYLTDVMQNLAIHRWLPFRGDRSVRIPP